MEKTVRRNPIEFLFFSLFFLPKIRHVNAGKLIEDSVGKFPSKREGCMPLSRLAWIGRG